MMKFKSSQTSIYVPDNVDVESALARCTHLAIGTHPDDVELIGMHGIHACYKNDDQYFASVVVTDGAGSPRTGEYAKVTDNEMVAIRKAEQDAAAKLGQYGIQIQLAYPSSAVKSLNQDVIDDLSAIFKAIDANTIYLHNPLDRHHSHRAVLQCCLQALNLSGTKPNACYGVEVWRSLDFLPAELRIALARDQYPELSEKLLSSFKSQIAGGKRYDLAFVGRGLANATFAESHQVDNAQSLSFAIDLKPLLTENQVDFRSFVKKLLDSTTKDCLQLT